MPPQSAGSGPDPHSVVGFRGASIGIILIGCVAGLVALVLALVAQSNAAQSRQEQAQSWRTHTLHVIIATERLDTALNKALRGERGYVLTADRRSLAVYEQALADYRHVAAELRGLTRDNPEQQRRVAELDRRVAVFASFLAEVVGRIRLGDDRSALDAVRSGRGREAVENASAVLDRIKAEEQRLLAAREAGNAKAAARAKRFWQISMALMGCLALVVAAAVAGMLRARAAALRAAAAATESERLYRLLAEHSNDMIVRIGLDGLRRFVSPACRALLGYEPHEMVGAAPVAAIHVEDRARVVAVCRTLLDGVADPICAYRQQHRDGHYVWLEATYHLIRDAAGAPTEFVASVRDVSRRRDIELEAAAASARLQENNRLFAMAAQMSQIGHWRFDLVRDEIAWSDEVFRIFGVGRDHVPGLETVLDAHHPDDRAHARRLIDRAIAHGAAYDYTARLVMAGGAIKSVAVHGQTERAPDGAVIGLFGVIQDVSAQVAADTAIRESEQQYRLLADNASDVILRTGEDGAVLYVSPSCLDLSGYTPDELVGRQPGEFIHPDDHAGVTAVHLAIVSGAREGATVEYRFRHKHQGWRWLESHIKAWRAPDGTSSGVISAIRDIAARKTLEADLVAARDVAENAARAKATFLANMSHEIRTPMNGVLGFTELLLAGAIAPEQRRHVELIAESGRSMMRLLNDILDVSKLESGKMCVTEEPVDLRHVARRCADLMRPIAAANGVTLSVRIAPDIPDRVVGDPLRLRQVLLNLLGNAVKFTTQGSVTIDAFVELDCLRLEVADTGIGIAPDKLGIIFDQFAQAETSTADSFGGTGLGLAISADLVKLMSGSISVRSDIGQGTTFTVLLPLRAAEPVPVAPIVPEVDDPVLAASTRGARVLIAEDHDINQVLILAMAELAGLDATMVADGVEAIAAVAAAAADGRPYQLVLMDMQMPRIDGVEATRRLRAGGHGPETLPIVALSANAYPEDVQMCLEAGMQAHLAKPLRQRDLAAVLARFLPAEPELSPPAPGISPNLLERYRARKAETLHKLDALAALDTADERIVGEAADLLHKLAGTAGMFGEPELGEAAKQMEDGLHAWPSAERAGRIRRALPTLRSTA